MSVVTIQQLDSGSVLSEERVSRQNAAQRTECPGRFLRPPIRPLYPSVYTSRAFLIKRQSGRSACGGTACDQ